MAMSAEDYESDDGSSSSLSSGSSSSALEVEERVPVLDFLNRPDSAAADTPSFNRLTVADASIPPGGDGAHESFVMLPSAKMRQLSLAEDDFVLVNCVRTRRSTVCAVLEDPYCESDSVLTNGVVRDNLGVVVGDTVAVWLLDVAEGMSVNLETKEKTGLSPEQLAREFIVPHYLGRDEDDDADWKPVFRGDLVPIPSVNDPTKTVTFRVVKTKPSPCCLVGPGTSMHVNGGVAVRPDLTAAVMNAESPAVLVVSPAGSDLASEYGLFNPEEAEALTKRLLREMMDTVCPACRAPMPPPHHRHYLACCGAEVCGGCRRLLAENHRSLANRRAETAPSWSCPFCRTPHATGFDQIDRLEGRMAKCNDPRSYFELGINYLRGKSGLHKDVGRAIELFNEGAMLGSVRCHETMGLAYRRGLGVEADESKAAYHLKAAADKGCVRSRKVLGEILYDDAGSDRAELRAAMRHWTVALRMGCIESLVELDSAIGNSDDLWEGLTVECLPEEGESPREALERAHNEYCLVFHTEARKEAGIYKVKGKGGS